MQDFNYVYSNSFEVTFELSCCKYPPAEELPKYWHLNKDALISFIEQSHIGVTGVVVDEAGEPVKVNYQVPKSFKIQSIKVVIKVRDRVISTPLLEVSTAPI